MPSLSSLSEPEIVSYSAQYATKWRIFMNEWLTENRAPADDQVKAANTNLKNIAKLDLDGLSQVLTTNGRKAFWINIYNGFMAEVVVRQRTSGSIKKNIWLLFWPKITVASLRFSLEDIEHGMLAANRPAPWKLWKQFAKSSRHLQLMVPELDDRIHFCLNCAGASCPPFAAYSLESLDRQMDMARENFLSNEFHVDENRKIIECSQVFTAYNKDFGEKYTRDPRYQGYKIKKLKYDYTFKA